MTLATRSIDNTADASGGLLVERILEFLGTLQSDGFHVGVGERLDALKVSKYCSITNSKRLYWGLRSLVATNPEEWNRFDVLFKNYWLPNRIRQQLTNKPQKYVGADQDGATSSNSGEGKTFNTDYSSHKVKGDRTNQRVSEGGASTRESLRRIDFRFLNDTERLYEIERWVEQLARRMKPRVIRRQRLFREGKRIHLRRTIRNSLPHGGTPLNLMYLRRRRKLPRLVLILDVSRSMSAYSYLFLRFARGIVSVFKDADAFVFHTHLVHVTSALRQRNIYNVKQKLAVMSMGWSGGTRIGECLRSFNVQFGRRLIRRRTIVVVLSDGLDSGDTDLLVNQVSLIKRRARKLIWLNPLLGREGYKPLAAGMQAVLPFVDLFAAAHDFDSLRALESAFVDI